MLYSSIQGQFLVLGAVRAEVATCLPVFSPFLCKSKHKPGPHPVSYLSPVSWGFDPSSCQTLISLHKIQYSQDASLSLVGQSHSDWTRQLAEEGARKGQGSWRTRHNQTGHGVPACKHLWVRGKGLESGLGQDRASKSVCPAVNSGSSVGKVS